MGISRATIDHALATKLGEASIDVAEALNAAGEECWWVGGSVRDLALGKVPKEIDMTTSAKPSKTASLFKKSDDSAASLGTIVVSVKGQTYEVTTFREDAPIGDGRRPESVTFSSREKDAFRRDATVNAMYWNPLNGELYDPCGGMKDMEERLVRFIGDPSTRIKEDALRILRLVRLRATIDGQYDPKTYKALGTNAGLTKKLSGVRILEELDKILLCPSPHTALEDLWELGVLKQVLPELAECKGIPQPAVFHGEGDVWNHVMLCMTQFTEDHEADVRLAALFHDIGKVQTYAVKERIRFDHHAQASADIASGILRRLQAPSGRVKKIDWLIRHHMMMASFKELTDARKAHWYFHPWFKELLEVFAIDAAGTSPGDWSLYDWIIEDYNEFLNAHPRPEKPLLSGDDVMNLLGIAPGAAVGEIIQALHEARIAKAVTTKKEAEAFVRSYRTKE